MTDGLSQNQAAASATPVENEKKFSQDEVNYLISKVKAEAKREVEVQSRGQDISVEKIEEIAEKKAEAKIKAMQEQYQNEQNTAYGNKVLASHRETIESGRKLYPDFDEVVGTINFGETVALIPLIQSLPNKEAVMYHLGKEDERFNQINIALLSNQPKKAENLIKKLSESIEQNDKKAAEAKSAIKPKEPLSQLKPSTTGVDGTWDIRSLKKQLKR